MDRLWFVLVFSGSLLIANGVGSTAQAANPFKGFTKLFTKSAPETKPTAPAAAAEHADYQDAEEPAPPKSRYPLPKRRTQPEEWQLPTQGSAGQPSRRVSPIAGQTPQQQQQSATQTKATKRVAPVRTASIDTTPAEPQVAPQLTEMPAQSVEAAPAAPPRIEWHNDLYEAHKVATQTGKPMLIVFGAEWCHYCKQLDSQTLAQPQMAEFVTQNFVPVHLDMDKDRDKEIARILGVKPIPCSVVLSPQADMLGKVVGFYDAPKYQKALEEAVGVQRGARPNRMTRAAGRR